MKNNRFKSMIMVGLALVLSFAGIAKNVAFADSNTMTVSPPYQKIILVPGETYKNSLSVFNSSNRFAYSVLLSLSLLVRTM